MPYEVVVQRLQSLTSPDILFPEIVLEIFVWAKIAGEVTLGKEQQRRRSKVHIKTARPVEGSPADDGHSIHH